MSSTWNSNNQILHLKLNMQFNHISYDPWRTVWVDIGNKQIGVNVMQKVLGAGPHETLHVGDQFLSTGVSDGFGREVFAAINAQHQTEQMNWISNELRGLGFL